MGPDSISYSQVKGKLCVKVHPIFKERFKKKFRSAKWNPKQQAWEISARSRKCLEQWIADFSEADKFDLIIYQLEEIQVCASKLLLEAKKQQFSQQKFIAASKAVQEFYGELTTTRKKIEQVRKENNASKKYLMNELKEQMCYLIASGLALSHKFEA